MVGEGRYREPAASQRSIVCYKLCCLSCCPSQLEAAIQRANEAEARAEKLEEGAEEMTLVLETARQALVELHELTDSSPR